LFERFQKKEKEKKWIEKKRRNKEKRKESVMRNRKEGFEKLIYTLNS
jgi:hypothetical protein